MSNNCNITEALKRIKTLNKLIDTKATGYNKKDSEEYKRVAASLNNMKENIDYNAESVETYSSLISEAKNISDAINRFSKKSPILEAVRKRYGDSFVSLANEDGTPVEGVPISSIVQIQDPTVLNSVNINGSITGKTSKLLKDTENALQSVLATSDAHKNSPLFTGRARTYNPALNFFSKALTKGTASNLANMVAAVRTTIDNYLVRNYVDLSSPKSVDDAAEMLSLTKNDLNEANTSLIIRFINGGSLSSIEGHKLGVAMMETLGLRASPDVDIDTYNSLVSGFGQIGLAVMAELGYIKSFKVTNEKATKDVVQGNKEQAETGKFYRTTDGGQVVVEAGVFIKEDMKIENLHDVEKNIRELNDLLDIPKDSVLPSFEPIEESKRVKIRRQPTNRATPNATEAVASLEKVEHSVLEEPLNLMIEAFTRDMDIPLKEVTAETLLNLFDFRSSIGIEPLVDDKGKDIVMSKNRRESIEAKNKALEDKVKGLFMVKDEQAKNNGKGFFYKWFVARQHRLHMHNTVASPQDDKLLARWLIQPKQVATDVSITDIEKTLDNPSEQVSMETDNFLYGLVQAFDGYGEVPNGEKVFREDTIKAARTLLKGEKSTKRALLNVAKQTDHIGHSFLAVDNILKYRKAFDEGANTFTSTMVKEIDGKTNGFAHKILQFPLGNYESLFKAVGIFSEETKYITYDDNGETASKEIDSTADKVANRETPDVYQLIAFRIKRRFDSIVGGKNPNGDKKQNKKQVTDWLEEVVPKNKQKEYMFDDEDLKSAIDVKKGLRNFAKDPTTHSMYGALAYNAGQNKARGITKDILDGFSRNLNKTKIDGLVVILGRITIEEETEERINKNNKEYIPRINEGQRIELREKLNHLAELSNNDIGVLQDNLINDYLESSSNELLYSTVFEVISYYYGQSIEGALRVELGPHEDAMQSINVAFQFVYDVFKKAYTARKQEVIQEKREKGIKSFTQSDHEAIVQELFYIAPGVKGVDSQSLHDSGLFIKPVLDTRDSLDETTKGKKGKEVRLKLDPNSKKGLSDKNFTVSSYLVNLAFTTMVNSFSDPKASMLPNATHMLDSANLVRTILAAKENGSTILPIHDAAVIGTGDTTTNKAFNRTFFEVNSEYSIMVELTDRFLSAYQYAVDHNIVDVTAADYKMVGPLGKEDINAEDIKDRLLVITDEVAGKRREVFGVKRVIGQVVGSKGTLYESEAITTKDDKNTRVYKEGVDPFVQQDIVEKTDTSAFDEGNSPAELVESSIDNETTDQKVDNDQSYLDLHTVAKYCK
jgi:hypothetical protein